MSARRIVLSVVALLTIATAFEAAGLPARAQEDGSATVEDEGEGDDEDLDDLGCVTCPPDRGHVTAALHLSSIEQLSATGGYVFRGGPSEFGWWLTASAALGGGELGVGRASIGGGCLPVGVGWRAVWLRTWGDPWHADPNESYVGLKFMGSAILRFEVGVLKRVDDDGDGDGDDWRATWSVGVGW